MTANVAKVASVSVPSYDRLMWPTLLALKELGGSGTVQELEGKVAEIEGFTPEQLSVPHGKGRQSEIGYRMAWARTYLRTAGAIDQSSRGVWAINAVGRGLSQGEVSAIPRQVKAGYRAAAAIQTEQEVQTGQGDIEPSSTNWQDSLLDLLLGMVPAAFERLCMRLLRETGFTKVEVTGRSGDKGIDGVGVLQMALLSFPVFFQCKRYRGSVGPSEVRDFRGAMVGRSDKGIMITTGTFTAEAAREATRDGAPVVDLIDGSRLCDLLKQYNLGVRTERVERITIEQDWFESF